MCDLALLRQKYKPDRVRVLFVGESPPANGTFFYKCDSKLYKHTKKVFQEFWIFKSDKEFLERFKNEGFYLEDLCDEPINHLPKRERKAKRNENIETLAKKLKQLNPEVIIVVMKSIQRQVKGAIKIAGLNPKYYAIPFPSRGWQKEFEKQLKGILTEIGIKKAH